eukprot:4014965-Alexandrium_andersonii.AAC.1
MLPVVGRALMSEVLAAKRVQCVCVCALPSTGHADCGDPDSDGPCFVCQAALVARTLFAVRPCCCRCREWLPSLVISCALW